MRALFVVNVVLLVVGPIVTIVLLAFVVIATKKPDGKPYGSYVSHVGIDVL